MPRRLVQERWPDHGPRLWWRHTESPGWRPRTWPTRCCRWRAACGFPQCGDAAVACGCDRRSERPPDAGRGPGFGTAAIGAPLAASVRSGGTAVACGVAANYPFFTNALVLPLLGFLAHAWAACAGVCAHGVDHVVFPHAAHGLPCRPQAAAMAGPNLLRPLPPFPTLPAPSSACMFIPCPVLSDIAKHHVIFIWSVLLVQKPHGGC